MTMSAQTNRVTIQNPSARELAATMLSTSTDHFDQPLDGLYDITQIEEDSIAKLYCDFQKFINAVESKVIEAVGSDWDGLEDFFIEASQFVHGAVEKDFVLTRNRAGSGFWDTGRWDSRVSKILTDAAHQFSEITCSVSDDCVIYFV